MKHNRAFSIVKIFFSLVCGILLILFPSTSASTLSYIAGAVMMLIGLAQIALSVLRKKTAASELRIAQGLVLTVGGLFILLRADLFAAFIPYLLSFGVLSCGAISLQEAYAKHRAGCAKPLMHLVSGTAACLCALLLMLIPFSSLALHYLLIGIAFVLSSLLDVAALVMRMYDKTITEKM